MLENVQSFWKEIPGLFRRFLITAIVLFVVWKSAYYFYLKPNRILDKPLTIATTKSTIRLLTLFYPNSIFIKKENLPNNNVDHYSNIIIKDNKKALGIADPCNGLELHILFVSFIICMPTSWKRMLLFSVGGIIVIYVCNVIRCASIGYLNISKNMYVDIAHHYIFKLLIYLIIFSGWVWYLKGKDFANEKQ